MRYRCQTREAGLPIHVGYLTFGITDVQAVAAIAAMVEQHLKQHGHPPAALIVDPIEPIGIFAGELECGLRRSDIAVLVAGQQR
jgi:hypothetical protein